MPAVMKMSSQPSALRSSTLGPQGQYVSTPTESETSPNFPPPWLANRAFPKMNRLLPVGKKSTGAGRVDRKSTRLNSSHSQISYAVFCLKKKKNTPTRVPIYATSPELG